MNSPMGCEGSTKIEVKWKVLRVKMEFVFLQPNRRLDVDEEKPKEHCWQTYSLLYNEKKLCND